MDINSIVELVSIGVSVVALLVAIIKRKKVKEYTVEELANKVNTKVQKYVDKVNTKAQKYVDKQCKKNKIEISDLTNKVEE